MFLFIALSYHTFRVEFDYIAEKKKLKSELPPNLAITGLDRSSGYLSLLSF